MNKVKVDYIISRGWKFEYTEKNLKIFTINNIIFAQKKEEQVDIIYELQLRKDINYITILKYYDGGKEHTIYSGPADNERLDKEMKSMKL